MDLLLEFLEILGRALTFAGVGFFAFAFLSTNELNLQNIAALVLAACALGLWRGAGWLRARRLAPPSV